MMDSRSWRCGFVTVALTSVLSIVPALGKSQDQTTQSTDAAAKECQCSDGSCETCQERTETSAETTKSAEHSKLRSTHRQSGTLTPRLNGKSAKLTTFRLRDDGFLVACVNPASKADEQTAGFIQLYSPDQELVDQYDLPFQATALDLDPDGNILVGGGGRIAKLDREGTLLLEQLAPNLIGKDLEKLKQEIIEDFKQERLDSQASLDEEKQTAEEAIKEIEAIEEQDRKPRQTSKLKRLKRKLTGINQQIEQLDELYGEDGPLLEWKLNSLSSIASMAATRNDVYVTTSASSGFGYEVYRLSQDLTNAKRVLKRLRGCCGQMDIHAVGDQLYVAENTKFNVGVYDRDGKEVGRFGQRLAGNNQGFGSCCNPMNVLCCPNGEVLTAESSVGKIKRFNADGELIGYVGRARIGGGCKQVALGHDAKRDRYYVQYEDRNHICILTPAQEDEPVDPQVETAAKLLTQGIWNVAEQPATTTEAETAVVGVGMAIEATDDGRFVIVDLIENSPAEDNEKIQVGDTILSVGESSGAMASVDEMELEELVGRIRGPAGQFVRLRLQSAETGKTLRTKVQRVKMELIDGVWVAQDVPDVDSFDAEVRALTNVKSFHFHANETVDVIMAGNGNGLFAGDSTYHWTANRMVEDVLQMDLESSDDETIVYTLRIKFVDDEHADIAIDYEGLTENSDFKTYVLKRTEN